LAQSLLRQCRRCHQTLNGSSKIFPGGEVKIMWWCTACRCGDVLTADEWRGQQEPEPTVAEGVRNTHKLEIALAQCEALMSTLRELIGEQKPVPIAPLPVVGRSSPQPWYIDGGCNPNSGPIEHRRLASVVTDAAGSVLLEESSRGGSNNIAELHAVILALRNAKASGMDKVRVLTDSRNNLAWTLGRKVGRGINDYPRVMAMREEIAKYRSSVKLTLEWIPRERNIAGHYLERNYGA
jgi:ribonuclease HI